MPAEFFYFPFDDGPGELSREDRWEAMMQFMRTTGVIIDWGQVALDPAVDDLAVTAAGGLDVQVAVGEAWIHGFMFQQKDDYFLINITPNVSGLDRIDLLTARLDTDANTIEYHVEEGVPALAPVAPTPVESAPIWDLSLASIFVADGAVTILPGDITDLRVISVQDNSSSSVTLASAGAGESLVADGTGPLLETKSLTAGMNITLTPSAGDITIDAADLTTTLASSGGTETLVFDGSGPSLEVKGLTAGSNITLSDGGGYVLIEGTGGGGAVTLANAGTTSLVNDGVGPSLATKGLVAGTGISFGTSAADVTITNSDPASGVVLTSAGGTETLVNDGTGPSLATKGLTAGSGISLTGAATALTIATSTPFVRLTQTAPPTIANGTTPTLSWNTVLSDTTGMYSGGNPTRITINTAGIYLINFTFSFSVAAGGTSAIYFQLYRVTAGPTTSQIGVFGTTMSNLTAGHAFNLTATKNLLAADYIYMVIYQATGALVTPTYTPDYSPIFSASYIGTP